MNRSRADAEATGGARQSTRPAVLVICNDSDYFLRHRRSIVEALSAKGYDVTVMTGGRPISAGEIGNWRAVSTPIARFSFSLLQDSALAWRTIRAIWSLRPDAVHLITLKPGVICGLAAITARLFVGKPRRILITIPGLGRLMSPGSTMLGLRARLSRSATRTAIRILSAMRGVKFTFETNSDRDAWVGDGLIGTDNSIVINGAGVDATTFSPRAAPSADDGVLRVLFASRLLYAKGLDAFVGAARLLSGQRVVFIVAGISETDDSDGYAPEQLADERAVSFIGEVKDMPELLRSVDVVCLPTLYGEGIPRILIEAAATGLPAISSDLDGCREIVKDGITGITVPVSESAEMSRAIAEAVTRYRDNPELRQRHGIAALALFEAGGFSETIVVGSFVRLLTED